MKFCRLLKLSPIVISVMMSACAHYHIVKPDQNNIQSLAIANPVNLTNEPRLSNYLKNNLTELFTFDGTATVKRDANQADCIINTKILSYDSQGIGETRISSGDDDQRKYRSTIFRVSVSIEYYPLCTGEYLANPVKHVVAGNADFTELVDIDIVRKDGLNRAINDACQKIVSNIIDTDEITVTR